MAIEDIDFNFDFKKITFCNEKHNFVIYVTFKSVVVTQCSSAQATVVLGVMLG